MSRKKIVLFISACLFFTCSALAAEIDCLQCHSDLAEGKSVHAAVSMGCTTCHTAVDARDIPHTIKTNIPKGLSSEQPGLCFDCHENAQFGKKNIHGALSMGCTSCHDPHASSNSSLKKAELPDLCYTCHDNTPFTGRNLHPPVAAGQCTACHLPHSADNASLLDNPVNDVCNACHDNKSSGKHILAGYGLGDRHPAQGKPDPAQPGKEISCVSCHTPHSSNQKFLFPESGNLCLRCHEKIMVRP